MVFALIFLSELALRIAAYRCEFFTGPDMAWNLFDTMLILSQAVEQGILGMVLLISTGLVNFRINGDLMA